MKTAVIQFKANAFIYCSIFSTNLEASAFVWCFIERRMLELLVYKFNQYIYKKKLWKKN